MLKRELQIKLDDCNPAATPEDLKSPPDFKIQGHRPVTLSHYYQQVPEMIQFQNPPQNTPTWQCPMASSCCVQFHAHSKQGLRSQVP